MSETSSPRVALLEDPQLRPFLALLYVAWADGDLEDGERAAFRERLARAPWLRPAARSAVESWLDPARPPLAAEVQALLDAVLRTAGTLSKKTRRTFADLAHDIAQNASPDQADAARIAAQEMAQALGLDGVVASTLLVARRARAVLAVPSPPSATSAEAATALRQFLDGRHGDLRDQVRSFLADPSRRAYGLDNSTYRALVLDWLRAFAETGLPRLAFPGVTSERHDLGDFLVAFETLGFGDLSLLVKIGVQFGLFGGSIFALGSARHRARLADVASLATLGCFAMSELGHGSNVSELETTATYEHATREIVIHTPRESARKEWIGGAAQHARIATVFAQLIVGGSDRGIHAVLVPIRTPAGELLPGVRASDCGHKEGLNGVDNGRLWFDQVRVPVDNLLDRFAQIDEAGRYQSPIASEEKRFFTMLGTLIGGRLCVGSAAVSGAVVALAIAIRYAARRRQFGLDGQTEQTLIEYRTHRRRLLPALATVYVHHAAFDVLRNRYAAEMVPEADTRSLEAEVAALKALATWHATDAIQRCREACGGQGYLSVNRLPDLRADIDVFSTFEGDNTVLLQLVAKSLLSGFRRQFEGTGLAGVLRHLGRRTFDDLADKNPLAASNSATEHLRDADWQLAMFERREERLLESAARRIKARLDGGADGNTAFLEAQQKLVTAALAHAERVAFGHFVALSKTAPPDARPLLELIRSVHALTRFEHHIGWFLEDGCFDKSKARAVRQLVPALLDEMAPHALALVDAFGIPDACLAAPIAFFDPAAPGWE